MPINETGFWVPPDTVDPSELRMPHPPEYSYRDSIPEAATKTPGELLTGYYGDQGNVRDWTDPNGVLRIQQETHRRYPRNAVLPIGSVGLVGKWPRPGGLSAVPVPIYGVDHIIDPPMDVIEFRSQDSTTRPSKGVSFKDILRGTPSVMEDADRIVVDMLRHWKRLNLIVAWPGYQPEMGGIYTQQGADGVALTRHELAIQIVNWYTIYFGKVERESLFPRELGFYNIALHQGENAKRDSLGVQLIQLHLVRLRRLRPGLWAAEVEIV